MNHKKILLIDDDEDDQLIFIDAITEIQYEIECITAFNCAEGLSRLKELPHPDFIFLDINMPLTNGFECLQLLKKEATLNKIPVIIFTTSDNPLDQIRAFKFGAEKYITKSSDFKKIKNKLTEILA